MTRKLSKLGSRSGRSVLLVVASLLVFSAVIRLAAGTGAAIALEIGSGRVADAPRAETGVEDISPQLVSLLEQTRARELALEQREAEIEARMQALALVETAVAEDIARLEEAETRLRQSIADANAAAENDIVRLTNVYENMKPEQAAPLFQRMEPSFAAGFLGRMRSDAAAAILAGLEPELAYSISVVLAGRNADVPREELPDNLPGSAGR